MPPVLSKRAQNSAGLLKNRRVSKVYAARLLKEYVALRAWVARKHPGLQATSIEECDRIVDQYVQFLYGKGLGNFHRAKHAVLSLQHYHRNLHGQMKESWDSLKTWFLELPTQTRIPVPRALAEAVFVWSMIQAFSQDRRRAGYWIPFGVEVLLGFEALARPGELVKLK